MQRAVRVRTLCGIVVALLLVCRHASAGTTGAVSGRVFDSATQAGIAGARVTATAPSQSASTVTDASGRFIFASLAPDTYVVTASRDGYDVTSQQGVTVLADQTQTLAIALVKTEKVLGKVNVTGAAELVKPGTTSDVYSINASGQQAAQALAGAGNLNQAYGAMATVPGVTVLQGQQGWYQPVYIRGGDLDQVGWEFDGIPVNRTYDNAPQTFVSSLGQQELQVYTGGTLATADASGIAGYVNQVVKRGTSPGFATVNLGIGTPAAYNKESFEAGGATPDQRFSYYFGTLAADQNYFYIDTSNGASSPGFFYPLSPPVFAPGRSYGIALTRDRETIGNLHFAVPHRNGPNDDVQLLFLTSYLYSNYYSSINDLGGPALVDGTVNGGNPIPWSDGVVYAGPVFAPPVAPANPCTQAGTPFAICYFFPSSPGHAWGGPLPNDVRDTNTNAVTVEKLQYQHNFSSSSYLRIFGYGLYSNWFIHGPLSAFLPFGAEIADYELPSHTYGVTAVYATQVSDKHLLSLSAFYNTTRIQRYTTTGGFPGATVGYAVSNDVDAAGNCFDSTGAISSCFSSANRGTFANPTPFAAAAGTQWLMTESGFHANFNKVNPIFSALSINDNWKPTDKLTVNFGVRAENYRIDTNDNTAAGYPARAFWFAAYNREFCFAPGYFQPLQKGSPGDVCSADWPLTAAVNLVNQNPGFSHTEVQPRIGATLQGGPDDVYRASFGLYSRPASTREASWNTAQQDLATFLGINFVSYGLFTPNHDVRPDRSTNVDASWEHHFSGTDLSFKISPFYRSTQDQVQQLIINALTGLFGSLNVGQQVSTGVELALQKGDFSRNGLAFQLAYTHTHSRIRYTDFPNGRNVIDNLNAYIQLYNSYTSACAGAAPTSDPRSLCGVFGGLTALATEPNGVTNPYFSQPAQPLLDRKGWYEPYDLIPQPFAAANGYEVPDVAALVVNYKRDRWSVTPSFTFTSGATYGSPLSWPGIVPDQGATASSTRYGPPLMIPDVYTGKFDNLGAFRQPSRITVNAQIGYQLTSRVKTTLTLASIVDTCKQRGYAWDYAHVCQYSSLPSSFLPPAGNFFTPLSSAPKQLQFPYAFWLNNNNTGFVGTTVPLQAAFNVEVKL